MRQVYHYSPVMVYFYENKCNYSKNGIYLYSKDRTKEKHDWVK